jgi:hypothetical protein
MNTHGIQGPVPLYELGWETKAIGALGNSPTPLSFASMSAEDAAYLFFKAETIEKRVEFTPLASGPGTRIDYSGAQGWDGTKAITTQSIAMWNPLELPQAWTPIYADSEAARIGIRGYDVAAWTPPENPQDNVDEFGAIGSPGTWMGIGSGQSGTLSYVDGTMRYNIMEPWAGLKTGFFASIQAQLGAWQTRLQNWLESEEAKTPQDLSLIADIQRQQSAQMALATQIIFQAENAVSIIEAGRALFTNPSAQDRYSANLIAAETEAFAMWIAAEEKLEAFSVTRFPLETLRQEFADFVRLELNARWLGWQRAFQPGIGILGARINSSSIGALSSNGIPALALTDLAFGLAYPPQFLAADLTAQDAVNVCASVFELTTPEYTLSISSGQYTSTAKTAIGPVSFGLTSAGANLGVINGLDIPERQPAVRVVSGELLSGEGAGGCPIENPDCDPYVINFYEVFNSKGEPQILNTDRAANFDGDKTWAFQSPYASITGDDADVSVLQTFWQPIANLMQSKNTAQATTEACGTFRIEAMDGRIISEQPLYTQAGVVGQVNMIFKVLTERT